MSVTSQEDDGVMGGDERKRKIRSKSLSGPKLEGGNLEKGQSFLKNLKNPNVGEGQKSQVICKVKV